MDNRLRDKWWRLNNLYQIIDERGRKIRFEPQKRPVQTKLFHGLWYCNEILKARQHGITTFFCIFFLDECLFHANVRAGIIAHNREDAESFFRDKVKFAYDNITLPQIRAQRPANMDSARELSFSNNSAIRVGTSLRSATLQFLLISEYGKICAKFPEKAKEIRTGALNTVHAGQFIAIESTAEGRDGDFYAIDKRARDLQRSGAKLTVLDFKHHFFPWWAKPEYRLDPAGVVIPTELNEYFDEILAKDNIHLDAGQKAWYVKKYETQQDEMKREFPSTPDEAFEAAIIGSYYAKQMAKARTEKRIGAYPYNPGALVYTAWDFGIGEQDQMVMWFFQLDDSWINAIDYYENSGEYLDHYQQVMAGKGYNYGTHFAPHDLRKRDPFFNQTRAARAGELGINFERINRTLDLVEDINEVRRIFYRLRIDEAKCAKGIKALDNYRKEWDDKNGCFKQRPLHNWASNGADGLRTLTHAVLSMDKQPEIPESDIFGHGIFQDDQGLGWMGT